jgi:hypothetical protein
MSFKFNIDIRGYLKNRESYDLEYKQSFQLGDNLLKYIKTLVGMANNKGGQIIFGVQDKPHIPVGMKNSNFFEIDPSKIDRLIREYFAPKINWSMNVLNFNNLNFGVLTVVESEEKPVLCKKSKDSIFREGAIYYRYRAETKEIEYPDLKSILDKESQKERNLWMELFQKVAKIGVNNISLLDSLNGDLIVGDKKIVIDQSILDKISFIKEGHFTESNEIGTPTLKLIGNIDGVVEKGMVSVDDVYPYFTKELQLKLKINSHDFQCLIWKYNVKGNDNFHKSVKSGKSNSIHKYSADLLEFLSEKLAIKGHLQQVRTEFKQRFKKKN